MRVVRPRASCQVDDDAAAAVTPQEFQSALERLVAADARLAHAVALAGPPPQRSRPAGFSGLVRTIAAQQISAAAAASLWRRLEETIRPLTPEAVAGMAITTLRARGLSRQKADYVRALAREIAAARVDLAGIHAMADEPAIAALTALKGIGRWSAEIYLLFALGRPDIWPADDLALQIAVQRLVGLRKRPDAGRLVRLAEPWRPYRSVAALLLWHFYASPACVRQFADGKAAASKRGRRAAGAAKS